MPNLDAALTDIAAFLSLDADALIKVAHLDKIGGFHTDPSQATFPVGSLWGVEGQVLYALICELRPLISLELGVWHGASSTHLLSAIRRNRAGRLYSVDKWQGSGTLVPLELRNNFILTHDDAVTYIHEEVDNLFNFVFEDCIHSETEVYAIVTALKPKLRKGAVVVHHDSEHGDDGAQIQRALARAGVNWRSWLIDPSDTGIAIWRQE